MNEEKQKYARKKMSQRALARMVDADPRTVGKIMEAAGISADDPEAANKVLNVEATKLGIKEENLMAKRADRMMREHKLALAKRGVIPADEVTRDLTRYVVSLKSKIFNGLRTAIQESGLLAGLTGEQITQVTERVHARAVDAFETMSKNEYGRCNCPSCGKEIQ